MCEQIVQLTELVNTNQVHNQLVELIKTKNTILMSVPEELLPHEPRFSFQVQVDEYCLSYKALAYYIGKLEQITSTLH